MRKILKKLFNDKRTTTHREIINDNFIDFPEPFPDPEPAQSTLQGNDAYVDQFDDMIDNEIINDDARFYYSRNRNNPLLIDPAPPTPLQMQRRLKKTGNKMKGQARKKNSVDTEDILWDEEFKSGVQSLL